MDQVDSKVIVIGRGVTGRAVSEFLHKKGAQVTVVDDRDGAEANELALCKKYDYAVVSPGVPMTNRTVVALKGSGVPILSELDLAYLYSASRRIYAVSGTNGKTTACTILHQMMSSVGASHLVGNVGVPWISETDSIQKGHAVVVEVSSFQIEQSQVFRPHIAALTNVGEDHLDRHITAEIYQRIKLSLLDRAEIKVINKGDDCQKDIIGAVSYSDVEPLADYYLSARTIYHGGVKYPLPPLSRGAAYDLDFLCAFTVACTACGFKKRFLSVYDKVALPPYRCHYLGLLAGAMVYNDSKGTNIDATLFATSQMKQLLALILGGSDKGEDFSRLFAGLGDNVERLYITGENAPKIFAAAEGGFRGEIRLVDSLRDAVRDFKLHPLPILLFSPASASFDRFMSYAERGRAFDELFLEFGGRYDGAR